MGATFTTIIVSWNTKDYLHDCLSSLYALENSVSNHIIVIDNASVDQSIPMVQKEFSKAELIENDENVGFAKACNQGVERSSSDIVLFLNSDCEIKDSNVFSIVEREFNKNSDIGVIGPLILYPNGQLQSAGQQFTTIKKLFRQQILFGSSPLFTKQMSANKNPYEADYVSGSCLFVKKRTLDEIGLFDESLIMYTEDMDLCQRVVYAGKKVVVVPEISVVHHKSKSTNKNLAKALRLSIRNNCVFIKNRSGAIAAFVAWIIYAVGTLLRTILAFFRKSATPKSWFKLFLSLPGIWKEILQYKKNEASYIH